MKLKTQNWFASYIGRILHEIKVKINLTTRLKEEANLEGGDIINTCMKTNAKRNWLCEFQIYKLFPHFLLHSDEHFKREKGEKKSLEACLIFGGISYGFSWSSHACLPIKFT